MAIAEVIRYRVDYGATLIFSSRTVALDSELCQFDCLRAMLRVAFQNILLDHADHRQRG